MQDKEFNKFLEESRRKIMSNNPEKKKDEPEDILEQARKRSKERVAERVAMADINVTINQLETEAARLEEEAREIRRRIAAGEPRPSGVVEDKKTEAAQNRLIALSLQLISEGIDPALIGQILASQSGGVVKVPDISGGAGVPKWMGEMMRDLIEAKGRADLEKVELELKHMKETFDHRLGEIAQQASERRGKGHEDLDPIQYAKNQALGVKAYYDTLKELDLIPERTPGIPASQTFEYQERQWTHEERKQFMQMELAKIEAQERIEGRRLTERREALASIPEALGGIAAKAIEDGMIQRRKERGESPGRPKGIPTIQIEPGEGDIVDVECAGCGQVISVPADSKSAACASCGMKYRVQHLEEPSAEA